MTGLVDIWIAVLAGAAACLAAGAMIALCQRPMLGAMRRMDPAARSVALLALIVAPVALGAVMAAFVAFSMYGAPFDLVRHHCHVSTDACVAHAAAPSTFMLTAAGGGLIAATLLWIGFTVFECAARTADGVRLLRTASDAPEGGSVRTLQTDSPVALASGLLRRGVYISRGLCARLGAEEREIVLAHEAAHARRFDNVVRLLAVAFAVGHWPGAAQALKRELALAQEQACDRDAARRFGAVRTAETLLKVERMQGGRRPAPEFGAAYVDAPISARVRALVAPEFDAAWQGWAMIGASAAAVLTLAFLGAEPLHHEIETFVINLQS